MSGGFEAALLPDEAKRGLCLDLLNEFGASVKRVNDTSGEMTHGCLVSPELHSNQTADPTASLNYKKLTYKCLGCNASGGLLWFIATCRNGSSVEARGWLEKQTGLGTSVMELEAMLKYLDQIYARPLTAPMPTYSERVLDPWKWDHPYLSEERGIHEENLRRFRVGWDPDKDRVTLPHFWRGKLVGWQTRRMPPQWCTADWTPLPPLPDGEKRLDVHSKAPGSPKYHSSPDFPKDVTLYNHVPGPKGVVVESVLSVVRHAHALPMVGTFGASVTETQIRRLTQYDRVVLWMDNDPAGWRAVEGTPEVRRTATRAAQDAKVGIAEALSPFVPVWVVPSPWAQDAGDLPTEEAVRLESLAVPWSAWKRPEVLHCYGCRREAHAGPCRP